MDPIILWFLVPILVGPVDSPRVVGQNFIGRGTPGYQSLNGDLAEFVVFTSTLSDADRDRVHGYLAHKWGSNRISSRRKPLQNHCSCSLHQGKFCGSDFDLDMRVEFRNGIPYLDKLDGLALWLDASDLSTVIKDSSNKVR